MIKKETIQNNTTTIIEMTKPKRNKDQTVVGIPLTSEFNPYQRASETYYFELDQMFSMIDDSKHFSFASLEILNDLEAILNGSTTFDSLEAIRKEATDKYGIQATEEIFMYFSIKSWVEDSKF